MAIMREVDDLYLEQQRAYLQAQNVAHQAVRRAVASGLITEKPCEVCGNRKAVAHHDDYLRPLHVTWLCQKHHVARHAELDFGSPGDDPDVRARIGAAFMEIRKRGRPPAAASAQRLSEAAAIIRSEPDIGGAELARRLGVDPSRGVRILAELRATVPDLPPAPATPSGSGKVTRLRQVTIERLAAATGMSVGEDLDAQVTRILDERDKP